jgi:hypothetical protein
VLFFASCSSSKESFSYLIKYLSTFVGEDAATLSEAKEDAVRAVIEFVKAPDSFQVFLIATLVQNKQRYQLIRAIASRGLSNLVSIGLACL